VSDLERRYLRLVRVCYPARYFRERGTELAGTYLELAAPRRRWPSPADVVDVAGGGLRQRVRAAGATAIGSGVRLAATLALLMTTTLAGGLTLVEAAPRSLGLGFGVWVAWLLVAVVHVGKPGRWTRIATGIALALTVAVVPLAGVTGVFRPPLFVLLPQATLGLVVLGLPGRLPVWQRLTPIAGAAALLPAAASLLSEDGHPVTIYYAGAIGQALTVAGLLLLLIAALLATGLAVGRDFRGVWAVLVLLGPIGMLSLHSLAGDLAVRLYGGGPAPTWGTLLASAIAVAVVAVALALLTLLVHARLAATRGVVERCEACGAPKVWSPRG
jgi:hypothetical protein